MVFQQNKSECHWNLLNDSVGRWEGQTDKLFCLFNFLGRLNRSIIYIACRPKYIKNINASHTLSFITSQNTDKKS